MKKNTDFIKSVYGGIIYKEHVEDGTLKSTECPKCRKPGKFRSGVGSEHKMICPRCGIIWVPFDVEDYRVEQAFNLVGMFGDGI